MFIVGGGYDCDNVSYPAAQRGCIYAGYSANNIGLRIAYYL